MSNLDFIKDVSDEIFIAKNVPLMSRFFDTIGLITHKTTLKAKENPELVQIILPDNKIDTIIQWYNETIRFESTVPYTFKSGYIIIENKFSDKGKDYRNYRKIIRTIANAKNESFYFIKDLFMNSFLNNTFKTRIYFTFLTQTKIRLEISDCLTNDVMHIINFEVGELGNIYDNNKLNAEPILEDLNIDDFIEYAHRNDLYDHIISKFYAGIFVTIMWYIATNTNNTKYIYTEIKPRHNYETKYNIEPKDVKTITNTIYDFRKIKTINIDTLNKRKAGWTYSHSFEVHGHYRHYKNGKIIFIKPFIKGKEKKLKAQKIVLKPKE